MFAKLHSKDSLFAETSVFLHITIVKIKHQFFLYTLVGTISSALCRPLHGTALCMCEVREVKSALFFPVVVIFQAPSVLGLTFCPPIDKSKDLLGEFSYLFCVIVVELMKS